MQPRDRAARREQLPVGCLGVVPQPRPRGLLQARAGPRHDLPARRIPHPRHPAHAERRDRLLQAERVRVREQVPQHRAGARRVRARRIQGA